MKRAVAGLVLVTFGLAGCIGPGTHVGIGPNLGIGQTPPGLWRTIGGDGCSWARLRGSSGGIIASEFSTSGPRYAQILPTDAGFETSGCLPFYEVLPTNPTGGPLLATPGQPFREGDYLVHAEVAPGRYVASNGPGCYWARVKDFSDPNGSSIIANAHNAAVVDIAPTDFGFSSDHCGTWTFVGPLQPPPPPVTTQPPPPPVTTQPPNAPVINLWYGTPETFGTRGQPQTWDNVLGNVSDPVGIASLSYTLNGGPETALSWGPNLVRLVEPGDFNVEIAATSLNVGSNTVHIVATDLEGRQASRDVVVNKVNGGPWPIPYTADWSTAGGNVNSVAQVVDGRWEIKPDGTLHNTERGYDRTIAIGQASTWARYEVTAPITINAWDPDGAAIGIAAGWQGHTADLNGVPNSDQPRTGHPFPALFNYSSAPGQPSLLKIGVYANTLQHPEQDLAVDPSGMQLAIGVSYTFKFDVTDNASGGSHFALKVWQTGTPEPPSWTVQADGELSRGSILLVLHQAEASFGAVTVTPL